MTAPPQAVSDSPVRRPSPASPHPAVPPVSPLLAAGFRWYVRRYFRKHFSAVRVAAGTAPRLPASDAVVCYANHPGWWDPLLAVCLTAELLGGRQFYAPIDEVALAKYPVFKRLGFYGIEAHRRTGSRRFLETTKQLLSASSAAVWITPGGKFSDVRVRTCFQAGLSHLATAAPRVCLVPVAIEYVFWEERTPEALVEFGPPRRSSECQLEKREWHALLEESLAATQQRLAEKSVARNARDFDCLLQGSAGVGGAYDALRRTMAWLRWTRFDPRHGGSLEGEATAR